MLPPHTPNHRPGQQSSSVSALFVCMSQNLSFECKHSILTFTRKLGLFYDTDNTAKSGVSVTLGFTLLVHFHSDVLAHATFLLHVQVSPISCISLVC
jgi:hypothetical protein